MDDLEELDGEEGGNHHPLPVLMFQPWAQLAEHLMPAIKPIIELALDALSTEGRKPRRELVSGIETVIPTIIANLLVLHRDHPQGTRLAIDLKHRKKSRYDRRELRQLPAVIEVLKQSGYIIKHPYVFKRKRTTIEPAAKLIPLLADPKVCLSDITRVEGEELIILTARPEVRTIRGKKQPKVLVNYKDTEQTIRLREEMEEINRHLSSHTVTLEGEPRQDFRLRRQFTLRRPDDPQEFNLHGRLYGGFWMSLKGSERSRLRIDGEPIADLDFASMFPRLAYAHVGKEPPEGDLYAIPGLENHREGAKAALSALLSYESEMQSLPSRLKGQLPEGWTARRVNEVFAKAHPDLVPLFGQDFGLDLMFTESRILLATLKILRGADIAALPMHDGMMVARSRAEEAKRAMESAALEVSRCRLPVVEKLSI